MKDVSKHFTKNTVNDILMNIYLSNDIVEKISFEKVCYTKENKKLLPHNLSLVLESVKDDNILYKVLFSFSSTAYDKKSFQLQPVLKYNYVKYIDNKTLKVKKVKVPNGNPTLNQINENPFVSPLFCDFVNMYNLSTENIPIDIDSVYKTRKYYPADDFEKLLYSSANGLNQPETYKSLSSKIKSIYLKDRVKSY